MRSGTGTRSTIIIAVMALMLAIGTGSVQATHGNNGQSISGASPHPTCNPLAAPFGHLDREQWPHLAVNPNDPNNIAVAWIQDWVDGIVVGVTHDGGDTWTKSIPPQSSACSGALLYNTVVDQHVSFGPDGRLYLSIQNHDSINPLTRVTVHVSTDGGVSWSLPVTLEESLLVTLEEGSVIEDRRLDWSWVVADPTRPGTVYATWMSEDLAVSHVDTRFARSTDGGQTWSTPWNITPAPEGQIRIPSMISALLDGSLVNLFQQTDACPPSLLEPCPPWNIHVMAARSTDQGDTWSTPVLVAARPNAGNNDDPRVFQLGMHPPAEHPVVSSDGTIYYAFADIAPDNSSKLLLTSSPDGGVTWSTPEVIRASNVPMANANLAVAPNGKVGVLFYDLRNDVAGDDAAMADVWFIHAAGAAGPWEEQHVAGPFDLNSVNGHIGLYQGIGVTPGGFVAAYTLGRPLSTVGPTDIFFSRFPIDP